MGLIQRITRLLRLFVVEVDMKIYVMVYFENGNSFKPVAETTTDDAGTSTTIIPGPITIEEKAKKKNDVKARSMLLMALPNEHLMTFNQYKDAKTLFATIKTRFGGYEATKKTQKTLLKQLLTSTSEVPTIFGVSTASPQTGKKITINGSDIAGYDKSKVESFNCHKMGHFARECKVLRNQENKTKNPETTRRTVNVEDASSKAMVAIDRDGFDWSCMDNDEAPTNMAFIALLDSEARCKYHQREKMVNGTNHSRVNHNATTVPKAVGGAKSGKITGKGTIRTGKLDFEDVYFVKKLQFNIFSVSQMRDKKNSVLFIDTKYFVRSHDFKLADESHVLLKVPRKNNMYSVDMTNIVLKKDLTCLVAKATNDESMLWHKRLGHINFKNINKLVKDNLTLDHLGKFDGKSNEGFFVGYSTNSKAFRVYNTRTRKVKENLHIKFLENKLLIAGQSSMEEGPSQDYILMPLWNDGSLFDSSPKDSDGENQDTDGSSTESKIDNQVRPNDENNTKDINTVGPSINTDSSNINTSSLTVNTVRLSDDYFGANNDMRSLDGVELDINNLSTIYHVPTTLNTRINKYQSLVNVIGDMQSGVQIRRMTVTTNKQGFISTIYEEKTHVDLHTCLFACFLSQEEPKRITNVLKDPAWVEAMQEELLQFHLQKVWTLVDLPRGFEDPDYPNKVYKVEKALYGLHQAPRAWYETMAKYLLGNRFRRVKIDQTVFIKRQKEDILLVLVYVDDIIFGSTKKELCTEFEKSDGIFISQDKYVDEILRKFKYEDVKPTNTPIDKEKALHKYLDGDDVDVHIYRSMIGSLMYLTSSRPDIMFVVCTCAKFHVTPKVSHLYAVKRIFRYLKGHPKLGLWYPKDSSFDLVAYTDSDYARASLDRKSTAGGFLINTAKRKNTLDYVFLGFRLTFTGEDNMVAFLKKPQGSEDFHQIVDFQKASHIRYALTENPTIYVSLINQFWRTASVRTLDNREIKLNAIVDGQVKTTTEASVRRHLKLADADGPEHEEWALEYLSPMFHQVLQMRPSLRRCMMDWGGLPLLLLDWQQSRAVARLERLSNLPNEPPLREGHTSRSEEGSIQILELMAICTKLSDKVTHLENELTTTKVVYNKALITLTQRVKKLEKKLKHKRRNAVVSLEEEEEEESLDHEDSPKHGRMIAEINKDENAKQEKEAQKKMKALKDLLKKNWDRNKRLKKRLLSKKMLKKKVLRKLEED
uniref:Uncharacterized mitochondrial protein AtMg00810-like n=1 Tax=Tanacetum cinerariifolium TaxID=118510 RepID=A0A6L2MWA1_TANCI|nr:uncharacterized mitochondrial protein AtMg00810-like [Tanacetum cinerariifolium]